MQFTKMHGLGNDYLFLDGFRGSLPDDLPNLARAMSDRHFGVGADGLITFEPSDVADARMRILNADGSEAEMCGNGLRCAAKALFDRGHVSRTTMDILTGRGILRVENRLIDGRVASVRVDMGPPVVDRSCPSLTLELGERSVGVHTVSMGNPHAVVYVDDPTDEWVLDIGPRIERHPAFPNRTNVEFVRVDDRSQITVRVWERGSGETLACGTGACAAVVAGILTGRLDDRVTVRLPGGELEIDWSSRRGVTMTGPATEVFTGEWNAAERLARAA